MIYLRNVKRIVALFMTLIMVLCCFIACNSSSEEKGCEHNIVIDQPEEATCTSTGLTLGKHCTKCGEILVAQETISKKSHEIVNDSAIAATCTSTGKTAGSHCRTCGKVITAQQTTPIIEHHYVNSKCSMCGKIIFTTLKYSGVGTKKITNIVIPEGTYIIRIDVKMNPSEWLEFVCGFVYYNADTPAALLSVALNGDKTSDYYETSLVGPMTNGIIEVETMNENTSWEIIIKKYN